jgi:phage anti-repressor protein
MISKCEKANLVRNYYIELEKDILVTLNDSSISRKELWLKLSPE